MVLLATTTRAFARGLKAFKRNLKEFKKTLTQKKSKNLKFFLSFKNAYQIPVKREKEAIFNKYFLHPRTTI